MQPILSIHGANAQSPECSDLRVIVGAAVKRWRRSVLERLLRMNIELDQSLPILGAETSLANILDIVFEQAIKRSPIGSELFVSAYRGENFAEVEIADSGPPLVQPIPTEETNPDIIPFPGLHQSECSETLAKLKSQVATFGGLFYSVPCPQGGIAWTIRMPLAAKEKQAA